MRDSQLMYSKFVEGTLQATLDAATPFSRRIFARRCMSPEEVESFLKEWEVATLTTVRPDGRPHASIGSFCYDEGRLYFYSNRASARHRNIIRNGRIAVTVVDGWGRQLIVEGETRIVGVASDLTSHVAGNSFRKKYGNFTGDRGSSSYVIEMTPNKIFSYKSKGRRDD